MYNLYSKKNPDDQIRFCKGNMCIEARGDNARLITLGVVFVLLCVGFAVLVSR